MDFTVPPMLIGFAAAACGILLIIGIVGLIRGKETESLTKIGLLGLLIVLFVDGISQGPISMAIRDKIVELIGQI